MATICKGDIEDYELGTLHALRVKNKVLIVLRHKSGAKHYFPAFGGRVALGQPVSLRIAVKFLAEY